MVYENILLLMDCSPVDAAVFGHVVELAKVHNSKVHLFHVVHAHTLDQRRVLMANTRDCLPRPQAMLEKEHISASHSFSEGEPLEPTFRTSRT